MVPNQGQYKIKVSRKQKRYKSISEDQSKEDVFDIQLQKDHWVPTSFHRSPPPLSFAVSVSQVCELQMTNIRPPSAA